MFICLRTREWIRFVQSKFIQHFKFSENFDCTKCIIGIIIQHNAYLYSGIRYFCLKHPLVSMEASPNEWKRFIFSLIQYTIKNGCSDYNWFPLIAIKFKFNHKVEYNIPSDMILFFRTNFECILKHYYLDNTITVLYVRII